ncbi:receptor-type tyrosine-protein phosphatase H-like [Cololabis saira]|uniref:receptor-type tyrosine-protein phosphatase H-like n=1 Tax=Cololabis saira TaxID=129043 RepID=UPI002AD401AC|nr:receptor-type tyrosine-protein phosphatase H-like [Cololabis saira]
MTKLLAFKSSLGSLLLCCFFSLLWVVSDCTTTSDPSASATPTSTASTTKTTPLDPKEFKRVGQTETSITLQWEQVGDIRDYILAYDEKEINIPSSAGNVTHTESGLTSGTSYNFWLFAVLDDVRSSGVNLTAVTVPLDPKQFKRVGENETSITLQWEQVEDYNYTLVFNESEINFTLSSGTLPHTISGLTSATNYSFSLFTVFDYVRSRGVNITAVTAPPDPKQFKRVGQNETSITLQWEQVGNIQYILTYDEKKINITLSEGTVTHTESDLTSGTSYNFIIFAVFGDARSSGVNLTAVTAPLHPENFTDISQNETSITLQWKQVRDISDYILVYAENETKINSSEGIVTHTVPNLSSGTQYNFAVFALFDYARSSGVDLTAATVPPTVDSVEVKQRYETNITLEWKNPNTAWNYLLDINGNGSIIIPHKPIETVSYTVRDLEPGTMYAFSVTTKFTGLVSAPHKTLTVTTIDCDSIKWHVTNSSIQGTVEGLFSEAKATNTSQTHSSPGGTNVMFTGLYPGATYEISLVYMSSKKFDQCRNKPLVTILPPNLQAYCEFSNAGYSTRLVWNQPDGVWETVQVNMTGETHLVKGNNTELIITGLQPAKTYQVSLASLSKTERSSEPFAFSCATDPRVVIGGSVFAVLLFALLVLVAAFILLKRPDIIRKKFFIGDSKLPDKKGKGISKAKFPDHFFQLGLDENRGFSKEYEDLAPVGTDQTRKAATQPENKGKNRYTNVLPYDWCRVKLMTSAPRDDLDYINASYMPGYNSNREYIAAQGPVSSTVKDFWKMIWEQKVKGIVMVTNCTENGRAKCEQYWPEERKIYGELLVTLRSEQQKPTWTLREFTVKDTNTSEEHTVKHFHFTAWPDHGVPLGTEDLIQFRGLVREHMESEANNAPTVVHCSAGVGRTGTIIALDVLLQQLQKEQIVDIKSFVHKMRLNRPYMVQTESQYVFLHQCIMDSLQSNESPEDNIYENVVIYENATALQQLH